MFGFHLHRRFEELGIKNYVVQPQDSDERDKGVKNDRLDAAALCESLDRYDPGNKNALSTVRIPTVDEDRKRRIACPLGLLGPDNGSMEVPPTKITVFSARGAYGWLYESRLGTEGLVTERSAYADVLAAIWRLMRSGTEPSKLKDAYARLLLMLNLEHTHPGNLRGYSLHLLNLRGVFNNMVSREYGPGGSTPDKPRISNLSLSQEEITEIEWRFEELRPFLRPGSFPG